jgi:hypothetical protein
MEAGNPRGLAVLQVRGKLPKGMTMLSFDTEAQLQQGEELFLLGFPHMATAPLALRRIFAGPSSSILQLDLPVGEGFSGTPVLRKGSVVGVVTDEDPQLTYAVKAIVAQDVVFGRGAKVVEICMLGEEHTENGIVFVRICPGTFTMGSFENDPQAYDFEKPAHSVTLSEFWIGKTEITNEQYRSFRADHQGEAMLPAANISWTNAKAACEALNGRLPTEAEWEYAARAGSQTAWTFPADAKTLGEYAWYTGDGPHPVATKKANAWGLHDMHGNVREWVADWYGDYPAAAQSDPTGPKGR